jgi:hypothetical protein
MTGWRLGWCAAPEPIAKAIDAVQSHSTSNPTSFAQKGAVAALTGSQDHLPKWLAEYAKRRTFAFNKLNSIPGITCVNAKGAFYLFPNISGTGLKSADFCAKLLEQEKVAAVPGIAFGADDYIRLSYATSMANIEKGWPASRTSANSRVWCGCFKKSTPMLPLQLLGEIIEQRVSHRRHEQRQQQTEACPPMTTTATARRSSAPGPVPSASGNMPAMSVSVVIRIGRRRSRLPWRWRRPLHALLAQFVHVIDLQNGVLLHDAEQAPACRARSTD